MDETKILPATSESIDQAVSILKNGGVVAIPTETVYGLAANALDAAAVARIYEAKGRPANNPLIVHVASTADAKALTTEWPDEARALAEAFWPGPLTIVLKKRPEIVPPITTAGGETVALRCPNHPVALELLRRCGFPLAAPSANRSNHISPTLPEHVVKSLGSRIPLVLDGGPCRAGIESTVLDLTSNTLTILRPGVLTTQSLSEVLAKPVENALPSNTLSKAINRRGAHLSPGQLLTHYAPTTPLYLAESETLEQILVQMNFRYNHIAAIRLTTRGTAQADVAMPKEPAGYAERLYAVLYELDSRNLDAILAELPPQTSSWSGVRDRLTRAGQRWHL